MNTNFTNVEWVFLIGGILGAVLAGISQSRKPALDFTDLGVIVLGITLIIVALIT